MEKGLEEGCADQIGGYVVGRKGGKELLEELLKDEKLMGNASAKKGLEDLKILFEYLDVLEVTPRISFDLSLARGLDYYTGIIYEAITEGSAPPQLAEAAAAPAAAAKKTSKSKKGKGGEDDDDASATVGVGSIAGGGRYDGLVGMFSGNTSASGQVPCVGVSIGIERVFSIMMARLAKVRAEQAASSAASSASASSSDVRAKETEAFVLSMGKDGMIKERLIVAELLRSAGIPAEYSYKVKPKMPAQFSAATKDGVPFVVILAPDEWNDKEGRKVRVKVQRGKGSEEGDGKGEVVLLEELVAWMRERVEAGRLGSEEVLRRVMGVEP